MTRKSAMGAEEFVKIMKEIHGERGNRKMSGDMQRGEVTTSRWATGVTPIGGTEAMLARLLLMMHRMRIDWRSWLRDYMDGKPTAGRPLNLEDLE